MLAAIVPVGSLLLASFMHMAGSGVLSSLLAIRLEAQATGALVVGAAATAYFLGLTIGSRRVSHLVRRVGHIRAFAAFVSIFSVSALLYSVGQHPGFWSALRLVDGLCMAGVFVCLESWLSERAIPSARGSVLAAYMIAVYGGQAISQFLLQLGASRPSLPLIAASILLSLTLIPVLLTRIPQPELGIDRPLSIRSLYSASPLGIVGVAATGLILGAFYGLGAVYARRLGLDLKETSLFMSGAIVGGIILQWPLGLLADRFDRRRRPRGRVHRHHSSRGGPRDGRGGWARSACARQRVRRPQFRALSALRRAHQRPSRSRAAAGRERRSGADLFGRRSGGPADRRFGDDLDRALRPVPFHRTLRRGHGIVRYLAPDGPPAGAGRTPAALSDPAAHDACVGIARPEAGFRNGTGERL